MNIVLMGYRCTGKTKVGKALAEKLGFDFVDADKYLEKREGKTVKEIVDEGGWELFRSIEKEVTAELSERDRHVIATGGGVILDDENVKNLRKNGITILFKVDEEIIVKRILKHPATDTQRPSLTGKHVAEEVSEVLKTRNPLYEKSADHIIDRTHHEVEDTIKEIEKILKNVKI